MAKTLEELFRYLDSLTERAPLERLVKEIRGLEINDELNPYIKFADTHYARNLVRAGDHYHIWVMCWKSGQRSPIHDHARSCCAVRVLRGTATVTRFDYAPNGLVKATGSRELPPGSICATHDSDLHQISNLQAGSADLVTLHVYSPPLLRMATYSLTDPLPGEDVWVEKRKVVQASPENSETPLESVHGWVTPNRLFFVRNHFAEPAMDLATWRLRLEGLVDSPVEWTWDEIRALPERSVFATVECAGNGRSFLRSAVPACSGEPAPSAMPSGPACRWAGAGTGGPQARRACEVLFEGCDRGTEADHPEPMHFARSLPLAKALRSRYAAGLSHERRVARPSHGFPLRLFVPGWYGVASVKWLRRIEVIDQPFQGATSRAVKYTVQRRTPQGKETVIVGPMAVKSEIIRPAAGAVLGLGTNRLFGVAWAGEDSVTAVRGQHRWRPDLGPCDS